MPSASVSRRWLVPLPHSTGVRSLVLRTIIYGLLVGEGFSRKISWKSAPGDSSFRSSAEDLFREPASGGGLRRVLDERRNGADAAEVVRGQRNVVDRDRVGPGEVRDNPDHAQAVDDAVVDEVEFG